MIEGRRGIRILIFFYKMANAHRRNALVKIKLNRTWVSEDSEIKERVGRAFHSLLTKTGEWRPYCEGLSVKALWGDNEAMLEAPFSEEEVLFALSARSGDKAPDPNGFSMAFWQASWDFLKGEVMDFFRGFSSALKIH